MHSADQPKKLPRNYQLVYEVVCAQPPGVHADAGDIYGAAKRRQPGLGYSTVYRALDRLCQTGLVHEVRVPGTASALYEPARASHAHFRCKRCGGVEDIDYDIPPGDLTRLTTSHAIAIEDVSLTFNGVCQRCRAKAEAKQPRV
jgi:Fe2+ or Zn2+ uptake regulation protein